jgi:small nuclear ribonucleoprotein (snRNP)-like protein
MRKVQSWIAIFVLVFPVSPVVADDTEASSLFHALSLEERLQDISSEATRFFDGLPESERLRLQETDDPQTRPTTEATEKARLRVRLRQLPSGTEVTIVLRGGERVQGELLEVTEDDFSLHVPYLGQRDAKLKKTLHYEDVESAEIPEAKGWSAPEKIRELPIGKRIEIVLLDGSKVTGSLKSISARGFELEVGKKAVREYLFDEAACLRPAGMRRSTKIVLAVGIPLAILGVFVAVLENMEE